MLVSKYWQIGLSVQKPYRCNTIHNIEVSLCMLSFQKLGNGLIICAPTLCCQLGLQSLVSCWTGCLWLDWFRLVCLVHNVPLILICSVRWFLATNR